MPIGRNFCLPKGNGDGEQSFPHGKWVQSWLDNAGGRQTKRKQTSLRSTVRTAFIAFSRQIDHRGFILSHFRHLERDPSFRVGKGKVALSPNRPDGSGPSPRVDGNFHIP